METGKVIKIIRNVPQPIPVEIPKKKDIGKEKSGRTVPNSIPVRREEKVPA